MGLVEVFLSAVLPEVLPERLGWESFVFAFCDAEFEFAGDNSVAGGFL